jgi:hypothetical protein
MRFKVCVNHGSTFELRTTLTEDARGAKAAAEAGSNCGGIGMVWYGVVWYDEESGLSGYRRQSANEEYKNWKHNEAIRESLIWGGPKTRELICAP